MLFHLFNTFFIRNWYKKDITKFIFISVMIFKFFWKMKTQIKFFHVLEFVAFSFIRYCCKVFPCLYKNFCLWFFNVLSAISTKFQIYKLRSNVRKAIIIIKTLKMFSSKTILIFCIIIFMIGQLKNQVSGTPFTPEIWKALAEGNKEFWKFLRQVLGAPPK